MYNDEQSRSSSFSLMMLSFFFCVIMVHISLRILRISFWSENCCSLGDVRLYAKTVDSSRGVRRFAMDAWQVSRLRSRQLITYSALFCVFVLTAMMKDVVHVVVETNERERTTTTDQACAKKDQSVCMNEKKTKAMFLWRWSSSTS